MHSQTDVVLHRVESFAVSSATSVDRRLGQEIIACDLLERTVDLDLK